MSWLVLGDLHLQKYPRSVPASFSYLKSIFSQVEEYARKNGVSTVVQVGDVHDGTGVEEDTRAFFMSAIHNSPLQWHFLMGNHDYSSVEYNTLTYYKRLQKSLGILPNARFYNEPEQTKLQGCLVNFLPWPHNKVKSDRPCINFAHFALAGAKGDNGYTLKSDITVSKKHYWEIGDLHLPQRGANWNYIGAPLQLTYGDTPNRYFGHYTGTVEKPFTKRIPIQSPYQLEQIKVTDPSKLPKLLQHLKSRNLNLFTQLKLGEQILLDHRYNELMQLPRLNTGFADKQKKEDSSEEQVVLIDSKSVRETLVRNRLKKKGFSLKQIEKAISLVNELERETL